MFNYLSKHPKIAATKRKEHHFFNCNKNYAKGFVFYQNLFLVTAADQLTFDASPGYLVDPKSPSRIYSYNPKIKMIVLLRNPVDRAYSAWQMYTQRYKSNRDWYYQGWIPFCGGEAAHYMRRNDESIFSFHSFIEEEMKYLDQGFAIEAPVLDHGFYGIQLERYFDIFNRDQILIIHSDMLRLHTREVLKNVQDFIGVKHHEFESEDLAPVFMGNYVEQMEARTRSLLKSYYQLHDERLFRLLNIQEIWWE